jgi:hypothetical protein
MTLRSRPYDIRSAMNASHDLVQWVSRIEPSTWTPQDLATNPSLERFLTPREIQGLNKQLDSNLLIAPTSFTTKDTGKGTSGTTSYQAYELPSGKLLRLNSFEATVPETGETGVRNVTVELILKIQADFSKNLL